MCGRYYIDDDTAREIEKVIRMVDEKIRQGEGSAGIKVTSGDICPTQMAPILTVGQGGITCEPQRWGYPGFSPEAGKSVVINARSETISQKRMFRDSILHKRIVIPATWFYEWNQNKEKYVFKHPTDKALFMAGCYTSYQGENRFVILTTGANASMSQIHDRMPLILEREEIVPWLFEDGETKRLLSKVPCQLSSDTPYQQMSLF